MPQSASLIILPMLRLSDGSSLLINFRLVLATTSTSPAIASFTRCEQLRTISALSSGEAAKISSTWSSMCFNA